MKNTLLAMITIFSVLMISLATEIKSPLEVVKDRIDGINQHDLEKFLGAHSEGVHIFSYPDKLVGTPGKSHLAKIFGPLFIEKSIQEEVHHQIQNGNHVISHETVVRQGKKTVYVYIYEIENGLIKSIRFINDK